MYRLAYRNFGNSDLLVVNHSVDVSGHSGVRWYEIKRPGTAPSIYQEGTYSPDASHSWMGSVAMDQRGNILLGYPLGSLQGEATLWTGSGGQTNGLTRWGDYSDMVLDPDDCTFWYTTEYLKTTGSFNWSTRIGSFSFPNCSCP